ncbi:MAG: glutamate--tRNA ligase [Burkholderiaceae bacterium]
MSAPMVRTRFAPSPTGFIHLGNVRSALYPWAYAKSRGGQFILRIEDTDSERSSQEAVDVILQSLQWLGLQPDEGPHYQMQRMARYREVLEQLKASGWVYPCYTSVAELDAMRERQMAAKQKPRYDGTWRPEPGKTLPDVPQGVAPVWRFATPRQGRVGWEDKVKGPVQVDNAELDDLVVARADGTPTYNFCVVVDDIDMAITHVIRGDDHVNNTPRQLHIFAALNATAPTYAHLPTVLNANGEKMSKRGGAKAVTAYRDEGFLPEAMVNYLARLGWSHGDDEIFSREQLLEWFDLDHLGRSAAQFDEAKLRWVNAQHIKACSGAELAKAVAPHLQVLGLTPDDRLPALCELFKDRCDTLVALAQWLGPYYAEITPQPQALAEHVVPAVQPALGALAAALAQLADDDRWQVEPIGQAIKATLTAHGLKMPQLAMAVRVLVMGQAQSPSLDQTLALHHAHTVNARLMAGVEGKKSAL